jgi:hypothetical protein
LVADLRARRNLELYLTGAVALVVSVLSITDVVDLSVVAAATLAVLALLAWSGLASRHEVAGLRATVSRVLAEQAGELPAQRFFSTHTAEVADDVARARDVRLLGVTLTRTVRDLLPVLERRLAAGASVRVVIIDVDSPARGEAVSRSRDADTPNFYHNRVSSTIDLLRVLARSSQSISLELRALPFVPTFGMCLTDLGEGHGRAHVEIYQHKSIEPNPSFTLRAGRDGRWYDLFVAQFDTLWKSGRPVPLPTPEQPCAPQPSVAPRP